MKSNIFKKAHELTKNIIKKGDNYRATFRLCLSFVYSQVKKGVNKVIELKGTEKQVKWAEDIKAQFNDIVKKYNLIMTKEKIYSYNCITDAKYWINNRKLLARAEELIEKEMYLIKSSCNSSEDHYWFKKYPKESARYDELYDILENLN